MAEMLLENPNWNKDMIDWLIDWLIDWREANGTKNEKTESLPASDLDHLLSNFLLERMQEKRRRMQQFSVLSTSHSDT